MANAEDLGYVPSPDDDAIEDLVSQYDDNEQSQVKLYQVIRGEKDTLLEVMPPSEFDFVRLAKHYGRGEYRIKVYVPDVENGGRLTLRINRSERYGGPVDVVQVVTPAQTAPIQPASTFDPALLARSIAEAVAVAIAASIPRVDPAQARRDAMEDMIRMKELFGSSAPAQPGMGFDQMLNLFQKGVEMGQGMDAPPDGPMAFLQAIKPLAEPLGKAVEAMVTRAAQTPEPVVQAPKLAAPAVNMQPPTPTTSTITTKETSEMFGINRYTPFKQHVDTLVAVFKRNPNTDPYAYAIMLLDELPDAAVDAILGDEKIIDNLVEVNPEVAHMRSQFDELLKHVRELTAPEPENNIPLHVPV